MGFYHKIGKIEGYTRHQIISFVKIKILTDDKWRERAFKVLMKLQQHNEIKEYYTHNIKSKTKTIFGICKNKECLYYNKKINLQFNNSKCPWCDSSFDISINEQKPPRGFSKNDSLLMTTIYRRHFNTIGSKIKEFTYKEKKHLKNVLPKYAAQIASISNLENMKKAMDKHISKKIGL